MRKLVKTDTTLVDILMVAKALPEDEIEQILAFGGNDDPERIAVSLVQSASLMWTARVEETGEPLVVGGWVQTGPTIFRSFFLANPRVWAEHGKEITEITAETIDEVKRAFPYVRLETYCLSHREKAREWYEMIGLSFDAELEGFGVKGESAVLYSAVGKHGDDRIVLATADGAKVS